VPAVRSRASILEGRALDVQIRAGWTEQRFFSAVREVAMRLEDGKRVSAIKGLGVPVEGVSPLRHPPQDRLVVWMGTQAHYLVGDTR